MKKNISNIEDEEEDLSSEEEKEKKDALTLELLVIILK
jgi:hypothetical protein